MDNLVCNKRTVPSAMTYCTACSANKLLSCSAASFWQSQLLLLLIYYY
jgi:hypothetical protein